MFAYRWRAGLFFTVFFIYLTLWFPLILIAWILNWEGWSWEPSTDRTLAARVVERVHHRMDPEELEDEELEQIRWTSLTFELVWHWRRLCRHYEDFTTIGFEFMLWLSQFKNLTLRIQQTGFKTQYLRGRDVCDMHARLTFSVPYLEDQMLCPDDFGRSSKMPWMLDKLGLS